MENFSAKPFSRDFFFSVVNVKLIFVFQAMRGKAGLIYEVDVDTSQIGFPYADSFSIFAHFCLKRIADNESSVTVHVDIKFKKPVWVMKSEYTTLFILGGHPSISQL